MKVENNIIDVIIFIQSMSKMGGTEIVALNLCNALNDVGVSTQILSVDQYCGLNKNVITINNIDAAKYGLRPLGVYDKFISSHRHNNAFKHYLSDFCERYKVRVLINFTYENLAILPFKCGIHTIGVYHWSVIGYENSLLSIVDNKTLPKKLISKIYLKKTYHKLHKLIGKTDKTIALTHCGANELKLLAPKSNIEVIPNFLPYTNLSNTISTGKNRRAVYVGRLSKEKGVYRLLEIWDRVARQLSDVELFVYGDGDERPQMEQIIKDRNIQRIYLEGFETDAEKIYSCADLLLCTSETEGFGMVLIEAMHFGVVPVAFDCPVSPKELIDDAGVVINCFDAETFSKKVVQLFTDNIHWQKLQAQGLDRVKEFYKPNVIKKWLAILKKNM